MMQNWESSPILFKFFIIDNVKTIKSESTFGSTSDNCFPILCLYLLPPAQLGCYFNSFMNQVERIIMNSFCFLSKSDMHWRVYKAAPADSPAPLMRYPRFIDHAKPSVVAGILGFS